MQLGFRDLWDTRQAKTRYKGLESQGEVRLETQVLERWGEMAAYQTGEDRKFTREGVSRGGQGLSPGLPC